MRLRFWLALKLIGPLPVEDIANRIANELLDAAKPHAKELSFTQAREAMVIGIETFWDLLNGEPG